MIYSNKEELLNCAMFCYNKLRLTSEVIITEKSLDVNGYCYEDGSIEINEELTLNDRLLTLCHEFVHCAQYEQGATVCEEEAYRIEKELYKEYRRISYV